ncbi:rutC family protein aq_364 [Planococcus citri]|uniref:rutC family protein aq_364 n=1 Tax=Planococcus citri TaxID=170843 RepID=UPI0031F9BA92
MMHQHPTGNPPGNAPPVHQLQSQQQPQPSLQTLQHPAMAQPGAFQAANAIPNIPQPSCTLIHAYNANTVPAPLGPYSSVVRVDNALYVSGVVAIDPKTDKLMVGGVEAETRKAMIYVKRILEEAGSSLERMALVRLYVTHIGDMEKINNVYEEFVSAPYPARVMVEVRSLPLGAHIEVEVMALISSTCRL